MLRNAGVSNGNPDLKKLWDGFKSFCAVPIVRDSEGFLFEAGFDIEFPNGVRTLNYSQYFVAFKRYWYSEGECYLAECKVTYPGHSAFLEWKYFVTDKEDDTDPSLDTHLKAVNEFIYSAEGDTELWDLLKGSVPNGMYSYAGPR